MQGCSSTASAPMLAALQVTSDLPEAFAVLGFAFYVQPMLMPLLHEMPAGPLGVRVTSTAVRWVVMAVASAVGALLAQSSLAYIMINWSPRACASRSPPSAGWSWPSLPRWAALLCQLSSLCLACKRWLM